ncbi:MAG: hypothetical protein ACLFS6_08330 [Methanomassiliicoccales archaeon]
MNPIVLVAGGGELGSQAARAVLREGREVTVVDEDEGCEAGALANRVIRSVDDHGPGGGVQLLIGDAFRSTLALMRRTEVDLLVPAVPGHLAGRLVMLHLLDHGCKLEPTPQLLRSMASVIPSRLIHLEDPENGLLATSYMVSGRCRPGCEQPPRCPETGEVRERPMHELLREAMTWAVSRHEVLVPETIGGVGCLRGEQVRALLENAARLRKGETFGVATSCRCHGIVNLFRRMGK